MLKIAHIQRPNKDESVRALAEIFKANDLRRQEKKVEQLKNQKPELNKKTSAQKS